jgi:hypothetical protein
MPKEYQKQPLLTTNKGPAQFTLNKALINLLT